MSSELLLECGLVVSGRLSTRLPELFQRFGFKSGLEVRRLAITHLFETYVLLYLLEEALCLSSGIYFIAFIIAGICALSILMLENET